MTKSERLIAVYHANLACGDISKAAEAQMLREIAEAEREEANALRNRSVVEATDRHYALVA